MAKTAIITRTYQDHAISYSADGWFNATEAAAKFGRRVDHWLKTEETKSYIAALCEISNTPESGYLKTKRGSGGGTWLHPKLAVSLARWLDPKFAVWCDMQIDGIIRGKEDWRTLRHTSASTNKMVNAILQMTRAEAGKDTQHFHYANEAKLVNWALCGEFIGLNRENLTSQELDLLAHLEERNAILLSRGLSREQRQPMLKQYAMDWRMQHVRLLED